MTSSPLWMGELRLGEATCLVQSHPESRWHSWDFKPSILGLLIPCLSLLVIDFGTAPVTQCSGHFS